jgi:hypothetical protein
MVLGFRDINRERRPTCVGKGAFGRRAATQQAGLIGKPEKNAAVPSLSESAKAVSKVPEYSCQALPASHSWQVTKNVSHSDTATQRRQTD